jgi:hypothetical protein
MRVALFVVFVSVLTTPSEASNSCMSKTEARQHFGSVHIYWHGKDHCWNATPTSRHHQIQKVQRKIDLHTAQRKIDQPNWHDLMSEMLPNEEPPVRSPWVDRWIDIELSPHCLALGRYRSGRAAAHHQRRTRAASHAARRGDGDHNYHTDHYDFRTSVRRHKIGGTHSGPFAGCATMKLTRRFAEMTPEKRPQDPHLGRDRPAL